MKLRSILSLLFHFAAINMQAQTTDRLVIINTIDKSDYFYIPKSAFADSVNSVLYQDKTLRQAKSNKRPIKLCWQSPCTDGDYNLTVTPEQIFFSSSHENPNPSRIFWVIDIDSTQFNEIRKGVAQLPPKGFDNRSKYYHQSITVFYDTTYKDTLFTPENWNDTTKALFEQHCDIEMWLQLQRCFTMLNAYITDKNKKIAFPTAQQAEKTKPKYFSSFKDEMQDWLPVKFYSPKVQN